MVGRSAPYLKLGTASGCGMNGLRNGLNATLLHRLQVIGQGTTCLPMVKPFREPFIT